VVLHLRSLRHLRDRAMAQYQLALSQARGATSLGPSPEAHCDQGIGTSSLVPESAF